MLRSTASILLAYLVAPVDNFHEWFQYLSIWGYFKAKTKQPSINGGQEL